MTGINLNLAEVAEAIGAPGKAGWGELNLAGISTDSRSIKPGELFVALRGINFDGHDYVGSAFKKGAAAAVIAEDVKPPRGKRCIRVPDTLFALGELAEYFRQRRKRPLKIMAITGSNGKTTTKEMVVRILSRKYKTLASKGNFNNLVGLPLSMFELRPEHEAAVLEMGTNMFGEIDRLVEIAPPNVGMITNVATAHFEGLGSLEGVARAKGELYSALGKKGVAIVNLDDPLVVREAKNHKGKKVTYGFNRKADVRVVGQPVWGMQGARFKLATPKGKLDIKFALLGRHNVTNAMAAAAGALGFGMKLDDIQAGLQDFQPYPGRLELKRLPGPVYLLDDTYNSNPASAQAALSVLRSLRRGRGRLVVVLGDMLELGGHSRFEHDLLGRAAVAYGVSELAAVGPEAKIMAQSAKKWGLPNSRVAWFKDNGQAADWLKKKIKPYDRILVKGSRGMKMESIVRCLSGEVGA